MDAKDLNVLLRRWKGDADAVASHHIFNQDELTEDDQLFLLEHRRTLSFHVLVSWLARGVKSPPRVVDRLVETWPLEDAVGPLMMLLAPYAARIEPDVYDDLVERVRDRTEPRLWWWLARSLTGMCPTFEHATKIEHAPELVATLFPHRRDERACRQEVLRLAREGGVVARGPWWSLNSSDGDAPSRLRDHASIIFWMEQHHLLDELSPGEVLPDDVRFPCEQDDGLRGDEAQEYLLRLALRWPGTARSSGRDWYIGQVLRAAQRGANWEGLLYDIVGDSKERGSMKLREPHMTGDDATRLVDDIAWRSFGTDVEAPWIGYAVCRALLRGEPDAWESAFRFLERRDLHFGKEQLERTFPWARLVAALHGADDEVLGQPVPWWIPRWILFQAPLPAAADEAFDDRLVSFTDTAGTNRPAIPLAWVERLADLPLTPSRANRLLAMVLSSEHSLRVVSTELLSRLSDAADVPVENLPLPEVFFDQRSRVEPARLAAYRKLGGGEADERLRRWMRAPLDAPPDMLGSGPWNAAERMRAVPDLAAVGLTEEILLRARGKRLLDLLHFQKEFPELISDAMVVEVATARVNDMTEQWVFVDKVELPAHLADLALQRCRGPIEAQELVALGRWLLGLGWDPRGVLSCLLDRSPRLPWGWPIQDLLREILSNRARWETFGPRVVRAMLEDAAADVLWSLVKSATAERSGEVPQGIVVAIHEAVAVVLLQRAATALAVSDEAHAVPALHALVALHPPARLSVKLLPMIPKTQPDTEARDLVELNLRLLKRSKTRDAQPADVLGALQLLGQPQTT